MSRPLSIVLGLVIVVAAGIYRTTDRASAGPIGVTIAVAVAVFLIGTWWGRRKTSRTGGPEGR